MASTADPSRLEAATARLRGALSALETAVARKLEADRSSAVTVKQIEALQADRAHLAEELDRASEHAHQLETVNREVARRLDLTMDAIRGVLANYET